jgi:hypothetical protein
MLDQARILCYQGEVQVLITSGQSLYWLLFIANSFINRVRGLALVVGAW